MVQRRGRVGGKVALVTGAAFGLGRAIAERLAQEGATLMLADINTDGAIKAAGEVGGAAVAIPLDVTNEASWTATIEYIRDRAGGLDILVNNAGLEAGPGPQDPERVSLEDWRAVQSVNVESIVLGCRYVLPLMRLTGGGSIVNVASVSGLVATPSLAAYGAAKAAVVQLTKTVAAHCGRKGYRVRCNCVLPGVVVTAMVRRFWERLEREHAISRQEAEQRFLTRIPLGCFQEPVDIANAVLFLASDEARYVTGIQLPVDGGFLLQDG
jgi:3(or 17)beta-hydroxysteroid dehydrogenase